MILDKQQAVREFTEKHGWPTNLAKQGMCTDAVWQRTGLIRAAHLMKQLFEFSEGWARKDLVEIADGVADILYLAFGAAVDAGIDIEPVFQAVHASNMSKAVTGEDHGRPRGASYVSPKEAIREELRRQGFFKAEEAQEAKDAQDDAVPDAP